MNDGKKKNVPLLKTNPISNIFIDVDHYGDFTECVITDFCIFFAVKLLRLVRLVKVKFICSHETKQLWLPV